MVTIEHLQSLYSKGNYRECLEGVEMLLLFNQQDVTATHLKAKCAYSLAMFHTEEESPERFAAVRSNFEAVLQLDPSHEEAMLFIAYINIFLMKTDLQQAISYCTQAAASAQADIKARAINYRLEAAYLTADYDQALSDATGLIQLTSDYYSDNRRLLDQELGQLHFTIANIYLEGLHDQQQALKAFSDGLQYRHADFSTYSRVAHLAFDNQDYETGGRAAWIAFYGEAPDTDEVIALYHRMEELAGQGIVNKHTLECMFIALRMLPGELGADTVEMLNFAQKYIRIFPDWFMPYHYAGSALFDEAAYAEALPYLKKSMELGGTAMGLHRYIETCYRLTGELPAVTHWPQDQSSRYYNAGVNFYTFEQSVTDLRIAPALLKLRTHFYQLAYEGFYDYFYGKNGEGRPDEEHTFAMCCNNYGIALTSMGEYEKAVQVHTLGYSLSPFWEQLSSWGTALLRLNRDEEAIEILNQAAAYSDDYLDFSNYIEIKGDILNATYRLGRKEAAKKLLDSIEEEYNDFIRDYGDELAEEELFILSERYITVQNIRQDLLNEGSIEDAVKAWQEQLEKHPDDNSSWFMLMQNYYQLKNYSQCIACADNYQAIKKDAIKPESSLKVHFMRGMSYLYLDNYSKARENLVVLLEICDPADESAQSIICDANLYLAQCCYMQEEWKTCMTYAWDAIACYNNNGWKWDDVRTRVTLYYADACKATGEKSAAIRTVESILEMVPDNEEALQRKKEWKSGGLFSFLKKK